MAKSMQDALIAAHLATAVEIEVAVLDLNQLRARRNAAIKRCLESNKPKAEQAELLAINKAIRALTEKK